MNVLFYKIITNVMFNIAYVTSFQYKTYDQSRYIMYFIDNYNYELCNHKSLSLKMFKNIFLGKMDKIGITESYTCTIYIYC